MHVVSRSSGPLRTELGGRLHRLAATAATPKPSGNPKVAGACASTGRLHRENSTVCFALKLRLRVKVSKSQNCDFNRHRITDGVAEVTDWK